MSYILIVKQFEQYGFSAIQNKCIIIIIIIIVRSILTDTNTVILYVPVRAVAARVTSTLFLHIRASVCAMGPGWTWTVCTPILVLVTSSTCYVNTEYYYGSHTFNLRVFNLFI